MIMVEGTRVTREQVLEASKGMLQMQFYMVHSFPTAGMDPHARAEVFTFGFMFLFLSHQPLNQMITYFNQLWSCLR